MEFREGQTATNPKTGVKIVFRDGAWHNAAADQGRGVATPESIKLTEDQGKSQTYARLMQEAEGQFQDAQRDGYDPNSMRNIAADFAEGVDLPLIGRPIAGMAPLIRDDASDRAVAARRAWLDAQLKAMTGAGQSQMEAVENPKTYFPQAFEGGSTAQNKEDMRATAYAAARTRAGPQAANLPPYWPQKQKLEGWTRQQPREQIATAERFRGATARSGTARNPYVPTDAQEYAALPSGSYFIHRDGSIRRKP